jgi:hypothetical protein
MRNTTCEVAGSDLVISIQCYFLEQFGGIQIFDAIRSLGLTRCLGRPTYSRATKLVEGKTSSARTYELLHDAVEIDVIEYRLAHQSIVMQFSL